MCCCSVPMPAAGPRDLDESAMKEKMVKWMMVGSPVLFLL
jgi:hypothetical protein